MNKLRSASSNENNSSHSKTPLAGLTEAWVMVLERNGVTAEALDNAIFRIEGEPTGLDSIPHQVAHLLENHMAEDTIQWLQKELGYPDLKLPKELEVKWHGRHAGADYEASYDNVEAARERLIGLWKMELDERKVAPTCTGGVSFSREKEREALIALLQPITGETMDDFERLAGGGDTAATGLRGKVVAEDRESLRENVDPKKMAKILQAQRDFSPEDARLGGALVARANGLLEAWNESGKPEIALQATHAFVDASNFFEGKSSELVWNCSDQADAMGKASGLSPEAFKALRASGSFGLTDVAESEDVKRNGILTRLFAAERAGDEVTAHDLRIDLMEWDASDSVSRQEAREDRLTYGGRDED